MSRSGYSEDGDDDQWFMIRWRGAVKSAIRGKNGQAFFIEMLEALDALPNKRLVAEELEAGGEVCALGAVGVARGLDMSKVDPEDYDAVAGKLGINAKIVQETVWFNDDVFSGYYWEKDEAGDHVRHEITPEIRFQRMRAWIERHISKAEVSL
jgi:hypothetical protein